VNGALRSDIEKKCTAEYIRLVDRISSTQGSACERCSKIKHGKEKNHVQPNVFSWWIEYVRREVNSALRSDVERKELRTTEYIRLVDRIRSTGGSVCEWRSKIGRRKEEKIRYSLIHSAGESNTFDRRVSV
jgi:hypothetical protein